MEWVVLSVFKASEGWIPSFVRASTHRFHVIDPSYEHDRSRAKASRSDWRDYLLHALAGWRHGMFSRTPVGFVCVFPQLALLVGILKRITFSKRPVIAWMFNFSHTHEGFQGRVARFGYAAVDRFVVHSTHEIAVYSRWLRIPAERFTFVPLSVAEKPITESEDEESPFLLSMGTPKRDYALLLRVLADSPYRALIVAAPHALEGLAIPPNIEVRAGLSETACRQLCQRARMSIVPLLDLETAAGQVTVVEGMMSGRPVVATRTVGTVDYIDDGRDAVLVDASDEESLRAAIDSLWVDREKRTTIGNAARRSALEKFTFRAVARHMERLMDDLQGDQRMGAPVERAG